MQIGGDGPHREVKGPIRAGDSTHRKKMRRHFYHSPLCSLTCSFKCFLKLKDFPQAGSGQEKDFWWMCWYFLWC